MSRRDRWLVFLFLLALVLVVLGLHALGVPMNLVTGVLMGIAFVLVFTLVVFAVERWNAFVVELWKRLRKPPNRL
jgi:hypothetical protein